MRTAQKASSSACDLVSEVVKIRMATAESAHWQCPSAVGMNSLTRKLIIVQTLGCKYTNLDAVPGPQCGCVPLGTAAHYFTVLTSGHSHGAVVFACVSKCRKIQ